jgi:D-ribose pyranose/furanose isomerase RbsD
VYERDPQLIKEPSKLYKKLFRVFIAQEIKGAHPIVEDLLQTIYNGLKDQEERNCLQFDLLSEILIKPTGVFNFGNFIDYIQSDRMQFIGINEMLQ